MSKLNAPRTIPYAFRVVAIYEWAWLYDDSERTFICDTDPKIFMEPLYALEEGDHEASPPESNYFHAHSIEKLENFPVPLDGEYVASDVSETDAWDSAREEAQGNCII
jgi:hypothetical protein